MLPTLPPACKQILVVDSGLMPLIKLRNFHLSKDRVDDSAPRGQVGRGRGL